jgi:hypothetical protein
MARQRAIGPECRVRVSSLRKRATNRSGEEGKFMGKPYAGNRTQSRFLRLEERSLQHLLDVAVEPGRKPRGSNEAL